MIAELKIYTDCTSEKPTKVYKCFQVPFGIMKKVSELFAKLNEVGNDEEKAEELFYTILKTIFPALTKEEFGGITRYDMVAFIKAIVDEGNRIQDLALKN